MVFTCCVLQRNQHGRVLWWRVRTFLFATLFGFALLIFNFVSLFINFDYKKKYFICLIIMVREQQFLHANHKSSFVYISFLTNEVISLTLFVVFRFLHMCSKGQKIRNFPPAKEDLRFLRAASAQASVLLQQHCKSCFDSLNLWAYFFVLARRCDSSLWQSWLSCSAVYSRNVDAKYQSRLLIASWKAEVVFA